MQDNVGIDVSKNKLDVAWNAGQRPAIEFENSMADIEKLTLMLNEDQPERIVLEATGPYHRRLLCALLAAKLPVILANPNRVRNFARAEGQLAKTDRIDARILALFAARMKPAFHALPNEQMQHLQELLARRSQLVDMRTAEANRLQQAISPRVYRSIEQLLDTIDAQLDDCEKQLDEMIEQVPQWTEKRTLLMSVPGVGDQTVRTLLINLPELGTCSRQRIAHLVGLAPLNRDSGTMRGRRTIIGGRAAVRKVLYMATLSATRHNPIIREFYQRMIQSGKAFKHALTACMRKLLVILNAMVRDQRQWQQIAQ